MNLFKTTDNGGLPFVLDDIRWMQDAWFRGFYDMVVATCGSITGDYVLWGCTVTDNTTTFDVSAGAVVFNGEIYLVEATTGLTKVALKQLEIVASTSTYHANGLKTFQDAVTHDTYSIRKGIAQIEATAGAIALSTTGAAAIPLKRDYMHHNYDGTNTKISLGNTAIDTTGTYYATNNIIAASDPVKYWKQGNEVKIMGGFSQTGPTSVTTRYKVGSLPSGYRPPHNVFVNGYGANNAGSEVCVFEVESGGDIYLRGDHYNTVYGSGITFHATTGIIINGSFNI